MTSKITKSIASRIPVELYSQLKKEAEDQGVNLNDYLHNIILARNEKQEGKLIQKKSKTKNEKQPEQIKNPKKKLTKISYGTSEILFPET